MIIAKNIESLLSDEARKKEIINSIDPIDYLKAWLPELINAIDPEDYYEKRRAGILKIFYQEQAKIKFDRKSLEHRYTDAGGHTYSGFPDSLGLPIERFGKMKFYLMWMVSGISPKELNDLLDRADDALGNGISDLKNAAMIGKIHEEIRGRERLTIHTELLYNFLAVQWCRDDENPLIYNNQIQLEKVEAFKKETASGNTYFFFQQKELKMLSNLFKMSEDEWKRFWEESLSNQAYLQALKMMKFSSTSENKESKEISTKA